MSAFGFIIPLLAFVAFFLSIWGLFNRGRSILCAFAGAILATGATFGAIHAWGESKSVTWTLVYLAILGIGIACLIRQAKKPSEERNNN